MCHFGTGPLNSPTCTAPCLTPAGQLGMEMTPRVTLKPHNNDGGIILGQDLRVTAQSNVPPIRPPTHTYTHTHTHTHTHTRPGIMLNYLHGRDEQISPALNHYICGSTRHCSLAYPNTHSQHHSTYHSV